MPHRALCGPIVARFCFVFSGFENAVSAPSLRTNYIPLGLESCWGLAASHACRTEPFADRLWHAFALFLAVSKMPFRHPICGRITYRFVFGGFEDAVSAPSLRTNYTPWLESGCFACMPHRALCGPIVAPFALFLAVSKRPFRHPVCGRITYPLGLNPAGVPRFARMPHRALCGGIVARLRTGFGSDCFGTQSADELPTPWA